MAPVTEPVEDEPVEELTEEAAVALVVGSVRRLFTFVPERQAQDLAAVVLRDLRQQGIRLVRDAAWRDMGD